MTDLNRIVAENQAALANRQQALRQELTEIDVELAAIDAYLAAKQKPAPPQVGKRKGYIGTGCYPHRNDGTLSIIQAGARFLGLKPDAARQAWRRGSYPSHKVGRFRRVSIAEMQQYMAEQHRAAAE